jgi:hypothetical protein
MRNQINRRFQMFSSQMRRLIILAVALAATPLFGPLTMHAVASGWTVQHLSAGESQGNIYDISCPSTSLCVAVGGNNVIASSTNPAAGSSAWKLVYPEGYTETGRGGGIIESAIRAVSCPSKVLCVAAGRVGHILTSTDPTGNASSWTLTNLGAQANQILGLSCPTTELCVGVSAKGDVITSADPTGGVSAWTITPLEAEPDLVGVDCPSTSLCVAAGRYSDVAISTDPTGGPSAWQLIRTPGGTDTGAGVSCPTASSCVLGGLGQILTSSDPTAGTSSWHSTVVLREGIQVNGVSCPALNACAAFDDNSDAIVSTDPFAGTPAWLVTSIIPFENGAYNGTWGISCPSRLLCVVGGAYDQIITSTDPFAAENAPTTAPKGVLPRKIIHPRVNITSRPPITLRARPNGTWVHFRFHSVGKASRFECHLSRRRRSKCRSPKSYRVAPGRYIFRVVAFGVTGAKGLPSQYEFWVKRR